MTPLKEFAQASFVFMAVCFFLQMLNLNFDYENLLATSQ